VNSNPAPSTAGVHLSMIAPCGRYTNPSRDAGSPAVLAMSVRAGTMGVEQRQRERRTHSTKEGAAAQVFLRNDHLSSLT